ncbi:hypothetical protein [Moraxella lacunata]|uniref:hypothetical protein n=1 Tax=Moraxella lacunata TaxID=477 RepID=UPI003EE137E5
MRFWHRCFVIVAILTNLKSHYNMLTSQDRAFCFIYYSLFYKVFYENIIQNQHGVIACRLAF